MWKKIRIAGLIGSILVGFCTSCTPPPPEQIAGSDIIPFIFKFIVSDMTGGTGTYLGISQQTEHSNNYDNTFDSLKLDEAFMVWWYVGDKFVEASNQQVAINEWTSRVQAASPEAELWNGCYYEFTIISESPDKRDASVYIGSACGPLGGQGEIYTLHAESPGEWQVIDSNPLWIS